MKKGEVKGEGVKSLKGGRVYAIKKGEVPECTYEILFLIYKYTKNYIILSISAEFSKGEEIKAHTLCKG